MNFPLEIQRTADGSLTLYRPDLDEHYHSMHGALEESKHVFIKQGLYHIPRSEVTVLEVGFGTGLNAWLTALETLQQPLKVKYITLEPYPLPAEMVPQLQASLDPSDTLFTALHQLPWESWQEVTPGFSMLKSMSRLEAFSPGIPVDVIYFDAFAPQKQSELWEPAIFERCYTWLTPGGCLTTYCAQGAFRRALKAAGFTIEKLTGPPNGKREMTRAVKL